MNHQFRPAIKRWIYQLPGGTVERNETPLRNAFKELEEELGYKASRMVLLSKIYTAPHITNDMQYIFLATGLKKTARHLEKGEIIRLHRIRIKDAIRLVYKGRIIDSSTIIGLLMFANWDRRPKTKHFNY